MIALDISGGQVFGDITCLRVEVAGCDDVGGTCEAYRITLCRGPEAGAWSGGVEGGSSLRGGTGGLRGLRNDAMICELRSLNDIGVDNGGKVIGEHIFPTLAVELGITKAVTCADHSLRIDLEGEP